jgi:serine/threonine protein kinase
VTTLPIGSEFGSYLIVRHIGGGGMAQIYLAKTRGLAGFEKYLALKVINPDLADEERFIDMLIDEAKITVGLTHVNIAQVFDLGQVEGIYYIAMEFVDGIDVLELVNGLHAFGEKVPIVAAAYVCRQICSGLHYAHSRKDKGGAALNIVHRDISPQNILVSRAGEVKVVDFGIAKAAGMSSKTQAGVIKGKIHYMAPEQALGEPAERRSDIFSSGAM